MNKTTTYVFHSHAAFADFMAKSGHLVLSFEQAPDRFIVVAESEPDEFGTEVFISAVYQ